MILDTNIEQAPGWGFHLGGNIGGVAPSSYTMDTGFVPSLGAIFTINGSAYADGEAYNIRPILLPTAKSLMLSFDAQYSAEMAQCGQAIEYDTRIEDVSDFDYNMSSQINLAMGGVLQISDKSGAWATVPNATPGILAPVKAHSFAYRYAFDFVKRTYGIVSVTIDGVVYPIPANMQGLSAQHLGWQSGAYLQVQMDLNAKGGQFAQILSNVQYEWS